MAAPWRRIIRGSAEDSRAVRQGGITRRRFTLGSLAAAGAGMAAISLGGCSDTQNTDDGEPQVVTDDSQIVDVVDDYENVDSDLAASATYTLPLGTVLFHTEGSWAAAMMAPESSLNVNTLGVMSLSSGDLITLITEPSQGQGYGFFDVRCSDGVFAWVEVDYTNRSWALIGQGISQGTLAGDAVKLDEGDSDWEPPRFTVWGTSVIWYHMPQASGNSSSEDSHCYQWTLGDTEGQEIWTSHGRFSASPRVADNILTIVPRVRDEEGVYYGLTAIDLTAGDNARRAQLVLPRSVAPFEATYFNESFAFSIEASYNGVGSLGNMGTFVGVEGGPYVYLRREPQSCALMLGSRYVMKSQASHFVIDPSAQTYSVLSAPDRCLDFGDWTASEGVTDRLLTYATVRNEQGVPASVTARVFAV